jgi:hypothetical protein
MLRRLERSGIESYAHRSRISLSENEAALDIYHCSLRAPRRPHGFPTLRRDFSPNLDWGDSKH